MRDNAQRLPAVEIGATFLAGFVATFALINAVWYLSTDDEDEATDIGSNRPSAKEVRFPWEPEQDPTNEDDDNNKASLPSLSPPKKNSPEPKSTVSHDEQLKFLAQMTFANGGIRAPSCACCA